MRRPRTPWLSGKGLVEIVCGHSSSLILGIMLVGSVFLVTDGETMGAQVQSRRAAVSRRQRVSHIPSSSQQRRKGLAADSELVAHSDPIAHWDTSLNRREGLTIPYLGILSIDHGPCHPKQKETISQDQPHPRAD